MKADLTVGVRQYDVAVPYGVVNCDGTDVRGIEEKPTLPDPNWKKWAKAFGFMN